MKNVRERLKWVIEDLRHPEKNDPFYYESFEQILRNAAERLENILEELEEHIDTVP